MGKYSEVIQRSEKVIKSEDKRYPLDEDLRPSDSKIHDVFQGKCPGCVRKV
jgi:hypothetical protein